MKLKAEGSLRLATDEWVSWSNLLSHKEIFNLVESDFQISIMQPGISTSWTVSESLECNSLKCNLS